MRRCMHVAVLITAGMVLSLSTIVLCHVNNQENGLTDLPYTVKISNDGPTIFGANTCLTSTLLPERKSAVLFYYVWEEGKSTFVIWCNATCNSKLQFKKAGQHVVKLTVFSSFLMFTRYKLAEGSTTVEVVDKIPSKLLLAQNGTLCNSSKFCSIANYELVQLTVDIYDPSNYLIKKGANLMFDWSLGDGGSVQTTLSPFLEHSYNSTGVYNITAITTATMPDGTSLKGRAKITAAVMEVINDLNITGVDHVEVGEERNINITCNGSPPVSFCWTIGLVPKNATFLEGYRKEKADDCVQTFLLSECQTEVVYKFNTSGRYLVYVHAQNEVSFLVKSMDVRSQQPNPLQPPKIVGICVTISFVIVATFCIMTFLVQQINKKRMRHVEVADFDFQANSDDETLRHARKLNFMNRPISEKSPLLERNPSLEVRWSKGSAIKI